MLFVLCLIPFWVSETVRTLGWMILLRESGVLPRLLVDLGITAAPVEMLYHDATILVGLVYTSMLFMVVPLVGALESLDDSLIEAAYDLGGNGWSILRQIVVPHAAPGIAAGCIVVFMLTLGNYLTPTLLGGKNSLWFTEQIYTQFITRFNWEQGAAFGFLLLVLSTAIVWLGLKLTRPALRRRDEALVIPSLPRSHAVALRDRRRMSRRSSCSCSCRSLVVAVFAFNDANYPAPPWRGFTLDWFVGGGTGRIGLFADAPLLKSVGTSVIVAAWVTLLSVAVGTANAFLLERAQFRGKSALSLLMLAPLVIPGVILGISILAFASRLAQFADDAWGLELDFLRPGPAAGRRSASSRTSCRSPR